MTVSPPPALIAAAALIAAVAILVICEECWHATHNDHRKGRH